MKKSLLLATLLLATFLRFYRLDAQSFWNDEGNSARLAERSVDLILAGAAGDIHPPGYYLLLAAWRAALGQSEFALRGLSAFAGIILVAIIYRLGKQYFDEPAALASAFFAAIHPALIYYSQEARMYELAAMWGAAAFLVIDSWRLENWRLEIRDWTLRVKIRRGLAFAFILAAGLYTHYSFAFIIIALNLLFLIRIAQLAITNNQLLITNLQSLISNLFLPQLLALLLFAPWLPTALRQLTTWPSAREYLPINEAAIGVMRWLTLGPTADEGSVFAIACASGLLPLALWRRGHRLPSWLWLLVPTSLTLGLGLFSPSFAKFLIVAVPALCLLMGHAMGIISAPLPAYPFKSRFPISGAHTIRILPSVLGLVVALSAAGTLGNLYYDSAYARADYRGIARYINSIAKPGDAILLNAPNQWEVFTYYHPDTSNVFPVARTRPLDVSAQVAELENIAATHDRLFVIYWGDAQSDPGRVIETWLNEHTFKAYDQWYGDVRLAAYAVPRTASTLQTRTDALFNNQIALEGYSLNANTFSPGDILQLTLFWRAQSQIVTRYKVFAHLIGDPASPPVAQHDGEPGGGLALTTTWGVGQTVADNHGIYLPLDLPPGDYTLVAGLYGVDDGARLQIQTGADNVYLTTITIR
ncbi:MAG: glycosyltransferase family 39 protein [Chloroflexi bacterium]|nr:glycosyltransferase family 39 protein [Chloroflexota bacterium]